MAPVDTSKPVGEQINPEAAKPKKLGKTVTMIFPHQIHLRETHHTRHTFKAGVNEVPEHLVDHPYLKVQGVKPYVVPKAVKPEVDPVDENASGAESEEQESAGTEPATETVEVTTVAEEPAEAPATKPSAAAKKASGKGGKGKGKK